MRVLACYHPRQFIPADAASDHQELQAIGWIVGEDSPHVLALVDPVGDTAVEVRRHPEVLLLENPALWNVHDRFATGAWQGLTGEGYEALSNWESVAVLTMVGARRREQEREEKRALEVMKGAAT